MSDSLDSLAKKAISLLKGNSFSVGMCEPISYGLQFAVRRGEDSATVRVYSGKKGLKIDLSQVHQIQMRNEIAVILGLQKPAQMEKLEEGSGLSYPMIGSDESGKGDYFGPIVVGAVYVDAKTEKELRDIGVKDCKLLTDEQTLSIADKIPGIAECFAYSLNPADYNSEYENFGNLNKLLASLHGRAINALLKKSPCETVLIDQFADERLMRDIFNGTAINIIQRTNAERYSAVAAASIVARAGFLTGMEQLSKEAGMVLPKGNSAAITPSAKEICKKFGRNRLKDFAKLHFKTTAEVLRVA